MIQNTVVFIVNGDGSFFKQPPNTKFTANSVNKNSIFVIAPFVNTASIIANFKVAHKTQQVSRVATLTTMKPNEITNESYVFDWNVWEVKVPQPTLQFLANNRGSEILVSFNVGETIPSRVIPKFDTILAEITITDFILPNIEEDGRYIVKVASYEYENGKYAFFNDTIIADNTAQEYKIFRAKYSGGTTPTVAFKVDPNIPMENFDEYEPTVVEQLILQANENSGEIVDLNTAVGNLEDRATQSESDIDLIEADVLELQGEVETHIEDLDNPHGVTAEQVDTYVKTTIDNKDANTLQSAKDYTDILGVDVEQNKQDIEDIKDTYATVTYVDGKISGVFRPSGNWNANTNTPTLANNEPTNAGKVYYVNVAGTQFGLTFAIGDKLAFIEGGVATKWDNVDEVTSVNGKVGTVVINAEDVGALPDDTPLFSGDYDDLSNKPTIDQLLGNLSTLGFVKRTGTNTYVIDTSNYQPLDADLSSIAGLSGTSGLLRKTASNTWLLDTSVYLTEITKLMVEAVLTGTITTHTHNASAIVEDASHRFVADTEKNTWNAKQNALGFTPENVANKKTTLSDSDVDYPTSKAVKTAIETAVSQTLKPMGNWNANTNTPTLTDSNINKANEMYYVSVAGTQFGIKFDVGDELVYNTNGVIFRRDNVDSVVSVNTKQGVVVLNQDDIGDGATYKQVSQAEKNTWNNKQDGLTNMSQSELNTGTVTTGRTISAKVLRDTFYTKGETDLIIGDIESLLGGI